MSNLIQLREAAQTYYDAGLNVLPATSKDKRPIGPWKEFIQSRPSFEEAFPVGLEFDALFVVCGATSGGLMVFDFDQSGLRYEGWCDLNAPDLLAELPNETTQHGGRHIAFRLKDCVKGEKLSSTADGKVAIETRGVGQGVIVAPSAGYSMNWGNWTNVPTITDEQFERFLETARSLDESPKKAETPKPQLAPLPKAPPVVSYSGCQSVADFLRSNLCIIRDVLSRNGWQFLRVEGEFERWARPGQDVVGKNGGDLNVEEGYFHCFSTNAEPLEGDKTYSPLQLIAALEYGGDESAAARAYAPYLPRAKQITENVDWDVLPDMSLTSNACGVAISERQEEPVDQRMQCYLRQMKRLQEEAVWRARRALEEIDVEKLNDSFPLDVVPEEVRHIAKKLAARYKLPYAPIVLAGLAILGGVLGCHKVVYYYEGRPIYPLLHLFLIGEKGAGKSTIVESFLRPIEKEFDDRWAEYWEGEKSKLSWLNAEIERLDKELATTDKNDPKYAEIINKKRPLEAQRDAIEWGGQRLVISGDTSFEAIWYQSYVDKRVSIAQGTKPIGKILSLGDASNKLKLSRNSGGGLNPSDYWAQATKVMECSEKPKKALVDKGRGVARACAVFLFDAQPGACYFIDINDLLVKGFDRRFLWAFVPKRVRDKVKGKLDLTVEHEAFVELVEQILNYQGGDLECGYEEAYNAWYGLMSDRINKAASDGDAELEAFLGTLTDLTIHVLALILHVCKFVKRGAVPRTIETDTFNEAARLIEAIIPEYKLTWRQMRKAVDEGRGKDCKPKDASASSSLLDKLTPAARSVYEFVRKHGEPSGESDRAATVTEIVEKGKISAYRTRKKDKLTGEMTRSLIDAELLDAGLMYVDEDGTRIALPVYELDSSNEAQDTQADSTATESEKNDRQNQGNSAVLSDDRVESPRRSDDAEKSNDEHGGWEESSDFA